ncbi:hypothetical protein [Metabacillus idriensis]|uniref:hypothetical protein n=1 Tax=Metabacillus idriensis TaxID=324768 RepID=UPI00174A4073|nr:hypothetical protein [Metabacillus idriensis]
MSINYRFNEWRVSGKQPTVWSQNAYSLVSIQVGLVSGMTIGSILYLHYVKGMTASQIKKNSVAYGMTTATVRGIIRGSYCPEAYCIFLDMLETEPEMLDRLFGNN